MEPLGRRVPPPATMRLQHCGERAGRALVSFDVPRKKQRAVLFSAQVSARTIFGNVKRSSARRPKVSMVNSAGTQKTQLMAPKPREAYRA